MATRGEFSSRIGFILAAAGSAVGLGNIWGFPTQVASNGGAAFVLMYTILAFLLAYPVLMAEFIIGRYARSNMVDALAKSSANPVVMNVGKGVGIWGGVTVSFILAFYAIVAGWMLAYFCQSVANILGWQQAADWLVEFSTLRNMLFCVIFMLMTAGIVTGGISNGIERWSVRLMPMLFVLIAILIIYVSTLPGAAEGWKVYVLPDWSRLLNPELLLNAMGQAFFSMSLGVGSMLVYGSYVSKKGNLPSLGASVALVDIGVAILAGMLIIPAMYVALRNGVQIFSDSGALIEGDKLIFTVLPALFDSMGAAGLFVSFAFFALMVIAALTSSISMLEVPVSYLVESKKLGRVRSVWILATVIFASSAVIIVNFESLFGTVITLTTQYSQPLLGLLLCLLAGWVWRRDTILHELKQGNEGVEHSLFWKIWPWYVRFVCPVIIFLMFYRSIA